MVNCGSICCIATFAVLAVVCLVTMCVGVAEKARFTPFYEEMKCTTPPAPLRFSSMKAPSPIAEALGIAPSDTGPFGLYFDMDTTTTCTNPNQFDVTMKAEGSKFELLQPDIADLNAGGNGLPPYQSLSVGKLKHDAVIAGPSGDEAAGTGKIMQVTSVGLPLPEVLALAGVAALQGYAPQYLTSKVTVETRMTMFGMPIVLEQESKQWCGLFSGQCVAPVVGYPTLTEPALCQLTRAVCSTISEEDMKASLFPHASQQLSFEANGGLVVGQMPCLPATGLPNGTMCNIVTAPGVDATTFLPLQLDPPKNTPKCQSELDEKMEEGEAMVYMMLDATIALNACLFVLFSAMVAFCCYRRSRASKLSPESGPDRGASVPRILDGGAQRGDDVRKFDS